MEVELSLVVEHNLVQVLNLVLGQWVWDQEASHTVQHQLVVQCLAHLSPQCSLKTRLAAHLLQQIVLQ